MRLIQALLISFLCVFLFTPSLASQNIPTLLTEAIQCLKQKHQLLDTYKMPLSFGYTVDDKSYPGERVIYLVHFPNSSSGENFAFAIFLTYESGKTIFNIQNNASFLTNKYKIIEFVNPPLGGVWTQQHLSDAIIRIAASPRYRIHKLASNETSGATICHSYTDHQ
jgi:hypothetical protein